MIDIQNVSKNYGSREIIAAATLTVTPGAMTAFIGPNGAGKSTLLSMVSRLTSQDRGEIYVDRTEVKAWRSQELAKKLAILKQSNGISLNVTVRELVSFGRFPYTKGRLQDDDNQIVLQALEVMGLTELAEDSIQTLSGGQLQRAYIAMVVAQDTDYILLDEPLNNLDMNYAVQMMQTLQHLVKTQQKTVVIVLHDINFAAGYADEILAMKDGKVFAKGKTADIITKKTLDQLYQMDVAIHEINGKRVCLYF